jgi:hypothetical protein
MSLETQGNDDILNPADGVIESTQDDLSTLATDVISSVPENKESQRDAADEQYYELGKTDIESGDLQDVTDAIDTQDNITASKITILG